MSLEPTPRAYLHEPCGVLTTAQWWREHRGVCGGCETTEGWSPLFSDTQIVAGLRHNAVTTPTPFLAVDAYGTPLICSERFEDDPAPKVIMERTDANAHGFDLIADLIADWRCEEWRAPTSHVGRHDAGDMARKADIAEAECDAALAEVERLRDALAEVRAAFDLQCPPMAPEKYVDHGAWVAHSWWNKVLGRVLTRAALLDELANK